MILDAKCFASILLADISLGIVVSMEVKEVASFFQLGVVHEMLCI